MSTYARAWAMPLIFLGTGLVGACTGGAEDSREAAIDDYIRGVGELPVEEPAVDEGNSSEPTRDGAYRCVIQPVEETRQYDELVAYDAGSGAFWPGAILRGSSIYTGRLSQMVFDRAPLEISISLANLDGAKSAVMDTPNLSSFRNVIGGILDAEVGGATRANLHAELEQVHNREQLDLSLGTSVSGTGLPAEIAASFNFDDESIRSRYLVRYTQNYYTVDVDQPRRPSDFFAPSVTVDDIAGEIGEGNPPVYVSSITYGRIVIFTFESEYSAEELGSALDFTYRGGVDVSGEVSVTYEEMVSRSNVTAYILGGSGGDAAMSLESYEGIIDFIEGGGNYSPDSPGAPIAYKLAYLKDNAPTRLSFTEEYELRQCERVSQQVRVALEGFEVVEAGGDSGDDLELFGTLGAEGRDGVTLFDKSAADAVRVASGTRWPSEGEVVAEKVLEVEPQPGESIILRADLWDNDASPNAPDDLGVETVELPYETGWRKPVSIRLTGDSVDVKALLRVSPI